MKKQDKDRINRVRTRKGEILAQMQRTQGDPSIRNKEHKLNRLNDQVRAITEKIMELRRE